MLKGLHPLLLAQRPLRPRLSSLIPHLFSRRNALLRSSVQQWNDYSIIFAFHPILLMAHVGFNIQACFCFFTRRKIISDCYGLHSSTVHTANYLIQIEHVCLILRYLSILENKYLNKLDIRGNYVWEHKSPWTQKS